MIHIRRAGGLDAGALAALLNEGPAEDAGTERDPVTPRQLRGWLAAPDSAWHLAEDDAGQLKGVQWIEPRPDLPPGGVTVATVIPLGESDLAIGSALFEATKQAARTLGYTHIHAITRADNTGGLAYYQSRGFEDFRRLPDCRLADGTRIDKLWKHYEL